MKLQSVEIVQGPWARRRGYATVKFGIAGGTFEMEGVPIEEARDIRAAVLGSIAAVDFSQLGDHAGTDMKRAPAAPEPFPDNPARRQ